jgi:hypothetical protein
MLTFVCTSISCAYDSVLQCLYSLNCSFLFILVKMRLPFGCSCFGLVVPGWELDGFPSYTTISISWTLSCWRMRTGIETLMPHSCFSSVVSFLHMRFREGVNSVEILFSLFNKIAERSKLVYAGVLLSVSPMALLSWL